VQLALRKLDLMAVGMKGFASSAAGGKACAGLCGRGWGGMPVRGGGGAPVRQGGWSPCAGLCGTSCAALPAQPSLRWSCAPPPCPGTSAAQESVFLRKATCVGMLVLKGDMYGTVTQPVTTSHPRWPESPEAPQTLCACCTRPEAAKP
jgi:hypothetical protein